MRIQSLFAIAVLALSTLTATADDNVLIFDKPAKSINDAVLIGNGTAGATIYGTFPDEKIELTTMSAPESAGNNSIKESQRQLRNSIKPLANLTVHHSVPVKSRVTEYTRGLNGASGTAFTDISTTDGLRAQKFYASAPDSVIIIEYGKEVPLFCTIVLTSDYATDIRSFDDQITMTGKIPSSDKKDDGDGMEFTTILKVLPGEGNITTNPDASLTLNYMKGATLVITTVKSTPEVRKLSLSDDGNPATDLARLRIFRTSLHLADGIDKYRHDLDNRQLADTYANGNTSDAKAELARYLNVSSTDEEGNTSVVLRTSVGHIEFLPGSQPGWTDGEATDVNALGSFLISFKWEKGKVTGGNITYIPKDYMPGETTVELLLNGEPHEVSIKTGETIPLENFVDLVRPFIQ